MTVRMGRAKNGGRREKGFRGREDTTVCLASAEVYVVVSSSLLHASSSYQQNLTDL